MGTRPAPRRGGDGRARGSRSRRARSAAAASPAYPGFGRGDDDRARRLGEARPRRARTARRRAARAVRLSRRAGSGMSDIGPAIEAYLTRLWETPVVIRDLARIPGGASRETYRFDAFVDGERRRLILRREPASGLID